MTFGAEASSLEAARAGDARAFERLVDPHRRALLAHGYRMLGGLQDAEDALQEALLAAWQGVAGFEGRSTFRTWLYTITTHACLRVAARRPPRVLAEDRTAAGQPLAALPEALDLSLWVEPWPGGAIDAMSPEARYSELESVELAFIAALQLLPATQRAVLVLRDVLGFSADETAHALDTSVASANSALQRARETLARRLPAESQQANRYALGDAAHRKLVERFVGAWEQADVDAIVALLAEDATFTMPPLPVWFRGASDIATFLRTNVFQLRWRFLACTASGQPAMAAYRWLDGAFRLSVLNVFTVRGDRVSAITAFTDASVGGRFDLPARC